MSAIDCVRRVAREPAYEANRVKREHAETSTTSAGGHACGVGDDRHKSDGRTVNQILNSKG